jgi:hypothetical protein
MPNNQQIQRIFSAPDVEDVLSPFTAKKIDTVERLT